MSECYEEFSSSKHPNLTEGSCDGVKENGKTSSARSSSSLYYNITQVFRSSSSWDINEDRPSLLPQKELRNSLSNSTSTSTRNSVCSLTNPATKKTEMDSSADTVSEASSSTSNNSLKNTNNSSPEVLTVSASALRYSASKFGFLSRKEKFLFLEHYKQYWVGLLGHTLYVYSSDKDSKPILELDIVGYQARPVGLLKDSSKKENSFEIFCPGSKTYQVICQFVF